LLAESPDALQRLPDIRQVFGGAEGARRDTDELERFRLSRPLDPDAVVAAALIAAGDGREEHALSLLAPVGSSYRAARALRVGLARRLAGPRGDAMRSEQAARARPSSAGAARIAPLR